jgi:hypothetical protein
MKYSSSFNHDLAFGEDAEDWMHNLFNSGKKIEVKYDRIAHETGNVFIEYVSRGKPSGISTTDADYWVYKIEKTGCAIVLPVPFLKDKLREYHKADMYLKDGGDNNTSKGFLIPIQKLITK